jgi:hypothetical protein
VIRFREDIPRGVDKPDFLRYNETKRIGISPCGKPRKGTKMNSPFQSKPITIPETPEELEKAIQRFDRITKERPFLNIALTLLFLLPIINLLTRMILDLPVDAWQYAEAFIMVLPIGVIWTGFVLTHYIRIDFLALAKKNAELMAQVAARKPEKP